MVQSKITILIPTFQRPLYFEQALRSAMDQTVPAERYKILVVDNDPTQGTETETIIKNAQFPNLRYVKNEKNIGGYANWNRGFQLADTEWICLLHDDDLLLPHCVERAHAMLRHIENDRLAAVIPWECNIFDDPKLERMELCERNETWKARLDNRLFQKTARRMWKVSLFDSYMCYSAYPNFSGGTLFRRSAVLNMGGFGTFWPSEDKLLMNRMARRYDCWLLGEQWGWYRYGENNMWAKPAELVKGDEAKKLFREIAAKESGICKAYHSVFKEAMCLNDRNLSRRLASRRGISIDFALYTWLANEKENKLLVKICHKNSNLWHMWISLRTYIFGRRVSF